MRAARCSSPFDAARPLPARALVAEVSPGEPPLPHEGGGLGVGQVTKCASTERPHFGVARGEFQQGDEQEVDGCVVSAGCGVGAGPAQSREEQPSFARERLIEAATVQSRGRQQGVDRGALVALTEEDGRRLRHDILLVEGPVPAHGTIVTDR